RRIVRVAKARRDLGDGRRIERECAVPERLPFGLDLAAERFGAELVYQYLDARLVDVVAAAVLIIDAQYRLDVAQQVAIRQKRLDGLSDERRAPEPAPDHHLEPGLPRVVPMQPQADIVHANGGAIVLGGRDRDLELARQKRKLGMQRGVLPNDFAPDARVLDLVGRGASP